MSRGTIDKRISERTGRVSWVARWSFGAGPGQRQHRERSFRTRKEATDFLTKIQHELRTQSYIEPSRQSVRDYLAEWHAGLSSHERRSSTLFAYDHMRRNRYGLIDDLALGDLRGYHIERMMTAWQDEGLSAHTRNGAFRMLRVALKDAVRRQKLITNPTDQLRAPKIDKFVPNVWSEQEIRQFLAFTAESPDALMWEVVFRTLIREGELVALRWSDFDAEAQTLHIERTVRRTKEGAWIVGDTPKSDASVRTIPLGDDLAARLVAHRIAQEAHHDELCIPHDDASWIFERTNGERLSGAAVFQRWKRAVERSGMKTIRLHDARHSGATLLIDRGVPVKTVSLLLGHSDAAFTMRLYIHPGSDQRRTATELLDRLLDDD